MLSVKKGLLLWSGYVLPALLPFMIGVNILKATPFPVLLSRLFKPVGKRLGLGSYGMFAVISGFLSGYPMGAKLVSELYNERRLTRNEAQYLLSFTNNSGPLFIIGTIGAGLLKSRKCGYYLIAVHILSALIIGLVLPKPDACDIPVGIKYIKNAGAELKNAIYNGIEAIVLVGGYIIFFSVICSVCEKALMRYIPNNYVLSVLCGILEITNGCSKISGSGCISLAVISLIIGFGGLSIHSQSIGYISSTDLSVSKYMLSKVIQGCIAFALSAVLYPLVFC